MEYRLRLADWFSDKDKEDIIRLAESYTIESFEAGGSGDGYAVAPYLNTVLATVRDRAVAVYSYDPAPRQDDPPAVEMIYVEPAHRRQGIASSLVSELLARVPDISLKSPLTPACRALADSLGIPATVLSPQEVRKMQEGTRFIRRSPARYCAQQGHRRTVAFQACERCTSGFPRLMARTQVERVFDAMRAADPDALWREIEERYRAMSPDAQQAAREGMVNAALGIKAVLDHNDELPKDGRS